MSQFGIIVNVDKCIGCQACFVACKEEIKLLPEFSGIRSIVQKTCRTASQLFPRELPALRQSGLLAGLPC